MQTYRITSNPFYGTVTIFCEYAQSQTWLRISSGLATPIITPRKTFSKTLTPVAPIRARLNVTPNGRAAIFQRAEAAERKAIAAAVQYILNTLIQHNKNPHDYKLILSPTMPNLLKLAATTPICPDIPSISAGSDVAARSAAIGVIPSSTMRGNSWAIGSFQGNPPTSVPNTIFTPAFIAAWKEGPCTSTRLRSRRPWGVSGGPQCE